MQPPIKFSPKPRSKLSPQGKQASRAPPKSATSTPKSPKSRLGTIPDKRSDAKGQDEGLKKPHENLTIELLLEAATRLSEKWQEEGSVKHNQGLKAPDSAKVSKDVKGLGKRGSHLILADLNGEPPEEIDEMDTETIEREKCKQTTTVMAVGTCPKEVKKSERLPRKKRKVEKEPDLISEENVPEAPPGGKSQVLEAALELVAKKLPKNAHAHLLLGLLKQRSNKPGEAAAWFQKASESVLSMSNEGPMRAQIHDLTSAQVSMCRAELALPSWSTTAGDKEAMPVNFLEGNFQELRQSMEGGAIPKHIAWNNLCLLLMRGGQYQKAVEELTSLVQAYPAYVDALVNLGVAHMHSCQAGAARKCFEEALLRDPKHTGALASFGALLLNKDACGPGGAGPATRLHAAEAAQRRLEQAVSEEPKIGGLWVTLATAYSAVGKLDQAAQCLEQAKKLTPTSPALRYAIAMHRLQGSERIEDPSSDLHLAASEMASLLSADSANAPNMSPSLAWGGLAMVHRAQHEQATIYEEGERGAHEAEEQASHSLKKAIEASPKAPLPWHQLGLHQLCTLKFEEAEKSLRNAIDFCKDFTAAWSNLGIALQLGRDASKAEEVYKAALEVSTPLNAHSVLNNLGTLYRQQGRFVEAHQVFERCFALYPEYAPAWNNLGLLSIAEGRWAEAVSAFDHALASDRDLDAARSNRMKVLALIKGNGASMGFLESGHASQTKQGVEYALQPNGNGSAAAQAGVLGMNSACR